MGDTAKRYNFTAVQVEQCKLDKRICGCGTIKDAIDTATKLAADGLRNDCATWSMVVHDLAVMLIANAQFAQLFHSAPKGYTEEEARDAVTNNRERLQLMAGCILAANESYIADKVNGPIREAYLDEPVGNHHQAPESKQ